MTLPEAQDLIRAGTRYADACEHLAEADRAALAGWYVREPGVPTAAAVRARVAALRSAAPEPTGESCTRCGSLNLFRSGACKTCADCGESGGCG